jgi:hypothetical protein
MQIINPTSGSGSILPSEPFPDNTEQVTVTLRNYIVGINDIDQAALNAGYTTRTFHDTFANLDNWSNKRAFGNDDSDLTGVTTGAAGLVFTTSATVKQYAICTAAIDSSGSPTTFDSGVAFGGGGLFVASIRHDPHDTDSAAKRTNGWPSFWAMSIEHLLQPDGDEQWDGQAEGYNNFAEIDFFESLNAIGYPSYTANGRSWYGELGSYQAVDSEGSWFYPPNTDFTEFHEYAGLWIPATATTQGYFEFFFDGEKCGSQVSNQATHPFYWDQWAGTETPPPVLGESAFAKMDEQHLALILGTGSGIQMEVEYVSVWQADDSNNLEQ